MEELSGIKPPTMNAFFHKFCEMGHKDLYPAHVSMPSTLEEISEVEAAYAVIGTPGACGSMDVVHIALGACPHGLINVCTGKEGYPTLAYNVISDHRGRALAMMPGAYGTVNDKTIVKSDLAVEKVRTDPLFTDYQYEVRSSSGERSMMKGAYLIVDGGYLRWKCLQCGLRTSSNDDYIDWRRRIESVRKDIECYFGRLKQRFKILRIPNLMKTKKIIDDMMFTIVAIQNMLLDYSTTAQLHTSWTVQLDWQKVDMNDHNGNASLSELLDKLAVAEQEDVDEEDNNLWIRPLVKKKKSVKKGLSKAHVFTDEFHDPGHDFSSIGLRGLCPGKFGWGDWGIPPEN